MTWDVIESLSLTAAFFSYFAAYITLWVHIERIRRETRASALPHAASLLWGSAALLYLWSERHREAKNERLSRRVIAARITQVTVVVGSLASYLLRA